MENQEYEDYLSILKDNGVSMDRSINPNVCTQIVPMIKEFNPKKILEIGRFKGHSLGLFRFLLPDSEVHSIDIVRHEEAVKVSEIFGNCHLIDQSSDALQAMDNKFDLILIDGDHSYDGCKKDWDNIQGHIEDRCMILFDDLGHSRRCGDVFYEIDDPQYEKQVISVGDIESMGVLIK